MNHTISLIHAYRNLDLVRSDLNLMRTCINPDVIDDIVNTTNSKLVHASAHNQAMTNISYNIVNSMLEQIRNLGDVVLAHEDFDLQKFDATFDKLYKEYLAYGPSAPSDAVEFNDSCTKFMFGLQCTHTDADGYGAVLPMQVADAFAYIHYDTYRYTFVIPCSECFTDAQISRALDAFADMFGHDIPDVTPQALLITDVPIDMSIYKKLRDEYGFTWTDNFSPRDIHGFEVDDDCTNWYPLPDVHFAMYIDHHVTNPFYKDYIDDHKELPVGVYTLPTLGELKTVGDVEIPEKLNDLVKDAPDDLKVAATFITAVLLDNLVQNSTYVFATDLMDTPRYRELYYSLCVSISQWDTFEWRDHPEFNPDNITPTMIGNMGFERPVYLDINDLIYQLWNGANYLQPGMNCFMPTKYIESLKEHDEILKQMAQKLWSISAHVTSFNLGIQRHDAPELWVVIPFSTLGNFSLVCHYMMQLDEYKKLKDNYTVGVMALDLMDETVSFRTDEPIEKARVDKIAKYYGGGGHPQASGTHYRGLATVVKIYLQDISSYRKNVDHQIRFADLVGHATTIVPLDEE